MLVGVHVWLPHAVNRCTCVSRAACFCLLSACWIMCASRSVNTYGQGLCVRARARARVCVCVYRVYQAVTSYQVPTHAASPPPLAFTRAHRAQPPSH